MGYGDHPNTKFPNKAFIFKAISIKHPTENKVAVFYNRADRTEFYLNDKLMKILHSQESFSPIMKVTKLEKGFSIFTINSNSHIDRHFSLSIGFSFFKIKKQIECLVHFIPFLKILNINSLKTFHKMFNF